MKLGELLNGEARFDPRFGTLEISGLKDPTIVQVPGMIHG